jgi:hypothetical protein
MNAIPAGLSVETRTPSRWVSTITGSGFVREGYIRRMQTVYIHLSFFDSGQVGQGV